MQTSIQSSRRWAVAALALALFGAVGTAAAQSKPGEPQTGAYGGSTYGGTTQAAPAPQPAPMPEPQPAPAVEPEVAYQPVAVSQETWYQKWGVLMSLGGGVEGFTNNGDTGTSTGGNWNIRASFGTKQIVGFEASYIGSAQSIDALGLDGSAVLVGNGLEGAARLNIITGTGFDIYGLGGVAWRHYDLTNENFNTSDVANHDDVLEIPLGGGVQYVYEGLLLDARAEYRLTEYGDLFTDRSNNNMDRWGVQGNIGMAF